MTGIFSQYPKINDVVNIAIRVDFVNRIKSNFVLFEYNHIKNEQTPEQMAYEIYGDPQLYWIILMVNDIDDLYTGWCMSDDQIYQYTSNKYGVENIYSIHHYEDSDGDWTSSVTTSPVSNLSYEQTLNENKRKIKIVKKDYISQILSELKIELRKN